MLSNEDLSVDDVILPKESNAVLCQENIDKVEQMHHHSYENEGKQQTIQESPSFAAIVKGSESGARFNLCNSFHYNKRERETNQA